MTRIPILLALAAAPGARAAEPDPLALKPGLLINYVHKNFDEKFDREFLVSVSSADESGVTLTTRFTSDKGDPLPLPMSPPEMRQSRVFTFGTWPDHASGAWVLKDWERPRTVMMASRKLLQRFKEDGEADLSSMLVLGPTYAVQVSGTLKRVDPSPEMLTVALPGGPRSLPALHVRGRLERILQGAPIDADFWFQDAADHPWLLQCKAKMGNDEFHVLMGTVSNSKTEASPTVEERLEKDCRAPVDGIYFAVDAADIQRESEPVLDRVAETMKRHPDWVLTIEGHTDNQGSPTHNRELSERRAAAVKAFLVDRLHVPVARLSASGFGSSNPLGDNATLGGRARNRRVELTRKCPAGGKGRP